MTHGQKSLQRARRPEDKADRRRDILTAAAALFSERPFADLTMAEVAARAGLAKGSLFNYFPTKEALFLALLDEELGAWLAVVDGELERPGPGPMTPRRVARLFHRTIVERRAFVRLLALLSTVLEHNLPLEAVVAFKTTLLQRLLKTGALLERRLTGLRPGDGVRLMLRIDALTIGLWQLADQAPVVKEALARPELAVLAVRFDEELADALAQLFEGSVQPKE
jgi:AcrR family transcriptional regulator